MNTPPLLLSSKITWCVGLAQLINWGITYYLLGAFGSAIANDTSWGQPLIFSGLTLAMGIMGLISPISGRLLASMGGRKVLQLGALLNGLGCLLLATSHSLYIYLMAWLVMGIGMRLSLYDAAFAVLVNLAGPTARKSITQVTLLGGLASVAFWPIGEGLLSLLGWRWGVGCYSLFALISILLCISLPDNKRERGVAPRESTEQGIQHLERDYLKCGLYAALMALLSFLSTGISTHLPLILASAGVPVLVGSLWGVGQVSARLGDIAMGSRGSALGLNLIVGITENLRPRLERLYNLSLERGAKMQDQLFNLSRFDGRKNEISSNMDYPPLRAFFRRLSRECGFTVSPHRFRHTIATNLMRLPDRNLKMAQDLLGHSTPAVTLEYVESDLDKVRDMLEELDAA